MTRTSSTITEASDRHGSAGTNRCVRWTVTALGCALVLTVGPARPAGAAAGPDLAAFSGCIAVHNADQGYDRGATPALTDIDLIRATLLASRSKGARKVARTVTRKASAPRLEAAIARAAEWCVALGVPPITLPTTAPAG
jgi:hypothetical protein